MRIGDYEILVEPDQYGNVAYWYTRVIADYPSKSMQISSETMMAKSDVKQKSRALSLPEDPAERKKYPVGTGVLDYFPDALVEVARVSYEGNQQHNPGQPLHWAREKSTDQSDTIIRHYLQRGTRDKDGMRHSAKMAWRALALLQLEIEAELDHLK